MDDYSYLIHSAKGTTWTKKDHKWIRKEGGKYYYTYTPTNSDDEDGEYRTYGKNGSYQVKVYNDGHREEVIPKTRTETYVPDDKNASKRTVDHYFDKTDKIFDNNEIVTTYSANSIAGKKNATTKAFTSYGKAHVARINMQASIGEAIRKYSNIGKNKVASFLKRLSK